MDLEVIKKRKMLTEKKLIEAIFYHSTEGIIVCKKNGEISITNPRVNDIFGYEQNELIGKQIEELIPPEYREGHSKLRTNYAHAPTPRPMGKNLELFGLKKNMSKFPIEVGLSPFSIDEEEYIVCLIIDISARKHNELKLKEYADLLKRKNEEISYLNQVLETKVKERTRELARVVYELSQSKNELSRSLEKEKSLNEVKSRFVSTASHEFRTPLGTILSSVSLIQKYTTEKDQEKREKHIHRIKSAVNHLTEMLNDFLSLDKLEEGIVRYQPMVINIKDTLNQIIEDITPILKNGQTVKVIYHAQQAKIMVDIQLLKNILFNLISNASKYSDEDKQILVETKIENGKFIMSVTDEGYGIPDADQKHIFARFFRSDNVNSIQGTGLGLNIVRKYLELMNGTISFISRVNEGSTFTVTIPFNIN